MANLQDYGLNISEFKLQSRYYIHFWTNAPWEKYDTPLLPPDIG